MKTKTCALTLLAALSVSISQPAVQAAQPVVQKSQIAGKLVKLGVLTDMTGPMSGIFGPNEFKCAKLAASDFVKKNKPDFKVEVVAGDHHQKPEEAVQKVREWFDKDDVTAVLECTGAHTALPVVRSVIKDRKKVFIVESAGSTRLTNEECTPYTIQYMGETDQVCAGVINTLVDQGKKTWFLIVMDTAFGSSFEKSAKEAIEARGGQVLGSVKHPLGTADFSSFILRAQASHADAVALCTGAADLTNCIKTANEFGIANRQVLAPLFLDMTDVRVLGLPVVKGTYHSELFYWDRDDQTRAWAKHAQEAINTIPNQYDALIYSAVTTYLKAVQATGTDDADAVMKYIKSTKINDFLCHDAYIRADGKLIHERYLMQTKTPAESKYNGDYFKILKVIPAEEVVSPLAKTQCSFCKK
jgi:branched-chain amino acid transport system substrate-binding protein